MLLTHAGHGSGGGVDLAALLASVGLGLFHGINPAMGWLFALSFGLQEKSRRALLRSLAWIVLGHELSVLPTALVVTLFASQVSRGLALGVVAVVLLVIAGVLALLGKKSLEKGVPPTPERTAENVKQDVQAVKEGLRS